MHARSNRHSHQFHARPHVLLAPPSSGRAPLEFRSWIAPESSWLPPDGVPRRRRKELCLGFRSSCPGLTGQALGGDLLAP